MTTTWIKTKSFRNFLLITTNVTFFLFKDKIRNQKKKKKERENFPKNRTRNRTEKIKIKSTVTIIMEKKKLKIPSSSHYCCFVYFQMVQAISSHYNSTPLFFFESFQTITVKKRIKKKDPGERIKSFSSFYLNNDNNTKKKSLKV